MMRKLAFWNGRHAHSLQARRKHGPRARHNNRLRSAILGVEQLESRLVLSANPILSVVADQFVDEGAPLAITNIGTFTDVVEGTSSGGAIGLDPNDFTSLGAFDPLTNVVIDTTALTISGGFSGSGTFVTADVGFGSFQIAVFTFSDFELDLGRTITATGSRPFALLSQSDMDVFGIIEASAPPLDGSAQQFVPGPGGGAGGDNVPAGSRNGDPAAGAPALGVGQLGSTASGISGAGGGFGGAGGLGENSTGSTEGVGGIAYADLATAIQGGSGGSASSRNSNGSLSGGTVQTGGGGGGGVELGAVGTVTITGEVRANGGQGRNPSTTAFGLGSWGGGGGAGGGILVHGDDVVQTGILSAKGGNGGTRGGGGGGGGEVLLVYGATGSISTNLANIFVNGGLTVLPGQGVATAGGAGTVTQTQQGSGSSPVIETFDYVIDWGDGSTDSTGAATIDTPGVNIGDTVAGSFDGSHTYDDGDDVYTVTVTINDNNGGTDTKTFLVTVANVAPSLTISGAASVNEGSPYTLNLSSFDPGDDAIAQWVITWGDGDVETVLGNPTSVAHTYDDGDNNWIISATATDEDGTFAAGNTVGVAVNNVAPTLAISGAAAVNEGASYTLNLSSFDPGDDAITQWVITWGDGDVETVLGNPTSAAHTYDDGNNNWIISATATDEDGTFSAGNTVGVTVNNVAPTLTLVGAALVAEGALYTLGLSSLDPGDDTITSWEITWGDGDVETILGSPASVTHTYDDGLNNWIVTATATDEDGTFAAGNTVAVTVDNVAPTLAISGAAAVDEGSVYTLNLSSFDPGADTITSWTINWGDGSQVVSGNPSSVTHTYADGTITYTISATATDEDGTFASNTVAVTVNNVAPTANAGGPYATFDDVPIVLNGSATDPAGAADPLTYEWDLDGDNVFGETGAGATRGDEVGANPTYDPIGLPTSTQTVKLRVSDGDGGVTTVTTTVDILGQGTIQIGGILYIVGSNTACDIVIITKCNSNIQVIASFNSSNPMSFSEASITEIQVRTRGGHDIVVTTSSVDKLMTIDGGSGNDLLTGGGGRNVISGGTGHDILWGSGGDDVLLGGDGNDDLFGGSGNDVLVGGNGRDMLNGGTGRDLLIGSQDEDYLNGGTDEDILIGGWTVHDSNVVALDAVMAVWGSAASFNSRVATLTGSGGLLQAGVAVFDDDDNDILVGGAGRDLVFGDTNPWDGAVDLIALQAAQDVLVAVN